MQAAAPNRKKQFYSYEQLNKLTKNKNREINSNTLCQKVYNIIKNIHLVEILRKKDVGNY